MNLKIDAYTLRLLRENVLYLIALAIFIFLLFFYLPIRIKAYIGLKRKITDVRREVTQIQQKKTVVDSFSSDEISVLITALDTLVPKEEDYLSILIALEEISARTGFRISSYTSPFSPGKSEKIPIRVDGIGTPESLLAFLRDYQYLGGRFMTLKSISLGQDASEVSMQIVFYNKAVGVVEGEDVASINEEGLALVREISSRLTLSQTDPAVPKAEPVDYVPRRNPFGN